MKAMPPWSLGTPFTLTTVFPVVAPTGTGTEIEVSLQEVGDANVPLNVTVLVPGVDPKLVPVMAMFAPTGPEFMDRLVITGVASTVNGTVLLPALATQACTLTLPIGALDGTVATIEVALQLVIPAETPPNVTVLLPCVEPKLLPAIVTDAFAGAEVGDKVVIMGVCAVAMLANDRKDRKAKNAMTRSAEIRRSERV